MFSHRRIIGLEGFCMPCPFYPCIYLQVRRFIRPVHLPAAFPDDRIPGDAEERFIGGVDFQNTVVERLSPVITDDLMECVPFDQVVKE
jgi:hypothetical protein